MTRSPSPFWIDEVYDRDYASNGASRFGAYVRDRLSTTFAECWDGTRDEPSTRLAEFASAAWRTATGPVMAPGYVRYNSRVRSASVERSQWDGSLLAVVSLVAPWPTALARSFDWQRGRHWRDWPTELRGEGYDFVAPTERDVAEYPFLQASITLTFSLPVAGLPAAPEGPKDDVEQLAREAVASLVAGLNATVEPVLDLLEGRRPR
ncbi:hypothetical protein [Actinomadura nitritigenes]|uniref:hypothetical protein n=1 Tax=Actinomadura nitritigenes TaxID=134602 RepID=UPI003D8E7C58